jgi:hypothetical protein
VADDDYGPGSAPAVARKAAAAIQSQHGRPLAQRTNFDPLTSRSDPWSPNIREKARWGSDPNDPEYLKGSIREITPPAGDKGMERAVPETSDEEKS